MFKIYNFWTALNRLSFFKKWPFSPTSLQQTVSSRTLGSSASLKPTRLPGGPGSESSLSHRRPVCAWVASLHGHMMMFSSPVSHKVTLFGEKAFEEVIKLKWVREGEPESGTTGVFIKMGNSDTDAWTGESDGPLQAEDRSLDQIFSAWP